MDKLLLGPLRELGEFKELCDKARKSGTIALFGLMDSQRAHMLAALADELNRPLLVVTANQLGAEHWLNDFIKLTDGDAALLPGREVSFASMAASRELTSRRIDALGKADAGQLRALVMPVEAMQYRLMPREVFRNNIFAFAEGDVYNLSELVNMLIAAGYERVDMIEGRGQLSLRGGILDIYSPGDITAVRIEFFDDEVDSIRALDVLTQRSGERLKNVSIFPACETPFAFNDPRIAEIARKFGNMANAAPAAKPDAAAAAEKFPWDDDEEEMPNLFGGAAQVMPPETDVNAMPPGLPSMSPQTDELVARQSIAALPPMCTDNIIHLVFENTVTPCEYLDNPIIVLDQPERLEERVANLMLEFSEEFSAALQRGEAIPEQGNMLRDWGEISHALTRGTSIVISPLMRQYSEYRLKALIDMHVLSATSYAGNYKELCRDIAHWRGEGWRVALLAGGYARGQRLEKTLLSEQEIVPFVPEHEQPLMPGEVVILPGALERGFIYPSLKLAIITEADIFGAGKQKTHARKRSGEKISAFTDLKIGDYVVHENHGIGVYKGMTRLNSDGVYRDYLYIAYQGNDKLYVPTDQLERVQKYIGKDGVAPKINKMSGNEWQRQKARVKAQIRDMADELVKLYAAREQTKGYAFSPDTPWQREFEDNFPYEETPDQVQSILEIKADMERAHVMDRLLCGDVGYGKTEVALRAAFKAVMDNKQVALLAPTTILVQQHYNTILKRFAGFPVRVEMLSRFKTPQQQKEILRKLAAGESDIVIGTHRLLGKDVKIKSLGLLIVDEEQRFGVKHKESIKQLKNSVDVLTLSATPIPRTLHMSMVGIRDMSVLETPPEERFPVQTHVIEYNDSFIRDAIMRELSRHGQVYFLYNRVSSIERFYEHLQQLVPEARIAIGHGQMREHALEDVMLDFYQGEYDILLCTTIIESGLDVANANTLIVYDADRFGLSQLYQLRGRVGRSNRLAYCYLTVRGGKVLSETADKRLSAIREFTAFGSGFRIAMRDLEIRGAGNLLGAEQHGHLSTVGYDLYCKMVEETLHELRGEAGMENVEARIEMHVDAYMPAEYVSGELQRIEVYKKISSICSRDDWDDMLEELTDRFGDPPRPVMNLMEISLLRKLCEKLWIENAVARNGMMTMKFSQNARVDYPRLIVRMNEFGGDVRFWNKETPAMIFQQKGQSDDEFLRRVTKVMETLAAD